MSQPYGKSGLPSDWLRNFLHSLTSLNVSQLSVSAGIRMGVFMIALLAIGLVSNHIRESIFAVLGTINVCMLESRESKWNIMIRTLILASIITASVFTIGSLIGTTPGYLAVPLFALGLFIISYIGIYPNANNIVLISSVVFSIGVALPGINKIVSPAELFWLVLAGGLWAVLGAAIIPIIRHVSKKSQSKAIIIEEEEEAAANPPSVEYSSLLGPINRRVFNPLVSNMSLRSGHFQFVLSFAVICAIGLLIAQGLGLIRGYWVLITICILLLRSDISLTFSFTAMRIIGTIVGAEIGMVIIANVVHNIWLLSFILFVFASTYFAVRNVNYALATLFLTPFVLVLLNILIPGQTMLAHVRIFDTLIGAGLSLLGIFIIWMMRTYI